MAGGKKKKITEDEYIELCNGLNSDIEKAYQAIKGLSTNTTKMMKGDSEGPYWNGAKAKSFYKTAQANLKNDIKAYEEAVEAWKKLRARYAKMGKHFNN